MSQEVFFEADKYEELRKCKDQQTRILQIGDVLIEQMQAEIRKVFRVDFKNTFDCNTRAEKLRMLTQNALKRVIDIVQKYYVEIARDSEECLRDIYNPLLLNTIETKEIRHVSDCLRKETQGRQLWESQFYALLAKFQQCREDYLKELLYLRSMLRNAGVAVTQSNDATTKSYDVYYYNLPSYSVQNILDDIPKDEEKGDEIARLDNEELRKLAKELQIYNHSLKSDLTQRDDDIKHMLTMLEQYRNETDSTKRQLFKVHEELKQLHASLHEGSAEASRMQNSSSQLSPEVKELSFKIEPQENISAQQSSQSDALEKSATLSDRWDKEDIVPIIPKRSPRLLDHYGQLNSPISNRYTPTINMQDAVKETENRIKKMRILNVRKERVLEMQILGKEESLEMYENNRVSSPRNAAKLIPNAESTRLPHLRRAKTQLNELDVNISAPLSANRHNNLNPAIIESDSSDLIITNSSFLDQEQESRLIENIPNLSHSNVIEEKTASISSNQYEFEPTYDEHNSFSLGLNNAESYTAITQGLRTTNVPIVAKKTDDSRSLFIKLDQSVKPILPFEVNSYSNEQTVLELFEESEDSESDITTEKKAIANQEGSSNKKHSKSLVNEKLSNSNAPINNNIDTIDSQSNKSNHSRNLIEHFKPPRPVINALSSQNDSELEANHISINKENGAKLMNEEKNEKYNIAAKASKTKSSTFSISISDNNKVPPRNSPEFQHELTNKASSTSGSMQIEVEVNQQTIQNEIREPEGNTKEELLVLPHLQQSQQELSLKKRAREDASHIEDLPKLTKGSSISHLDLLRPKAAPLETEGSFDEPSQQALNYLQKAGAESSPSPSSLNTIEVIVVDIGKKQDDKSSHEPTNLFNTISINASSKSKRIVIESNSPQLLDAMTALNSNVSYSRVQEVELHVDHSHTTIDIMKNSNVNIQQKEIANVFQLQDNVQLSSISSNPSINQNNFPLDAKEEQRESKYQQRNEIVSSLAAVNFRPILEANPSILQSAVNEDLHTSIANNRKKDFNMTIESDRVKKIYLDGRLNTKSNKSVSELPSLDPRPSSKNKELQFNKREESLVKRNTLQPLEIGRSSSKLEKVNEGATQLTNNRVFNALSENVLQESGTLQEMKPVKSDNSRTPKNIVSEDNPEKDDLSKSELSNSESVRSYLEMTSKKQGQHKAFSLEEESVKKDINHIYHKISQESQAISEFRLSAKGWNTKMGTNGWKAFDAKAHLKKQIEEARTGLETRTTHNLLLHNESDTDSIESLLSTLLKSLSRKEKNSENLTRFGNILRQILIFSKNGGALQNIIELIRYETERHMTKKLKEIHKGIPGKNKNASTQSNVHLLSNDELIGRVFFLEGIIENMMTFNPQPNLRKNCNLPSIQ